MKEELIKLKKPIPKANTQPLEPESEPETTETDIPGLPQALPEPEPTQVAEPITVRFSSTNSGGWKTSDILREIRLDNLDLGGPD
jgi:hypothetical protein